MRKRWQNEKARNVITPFKMWSYTPKKPSYQASQPLVQRNRGSAPRPYWRNSSQTPSSGVNPYWRPQCPDTPVCGYVLSKYYVQMCKKLQLLGDFFPQTSTGALIQEARQKANGKRQGNLARQRHGHLARQGTARLG